MNERMKFENEKKIYKRIQNELTKNCTLPEKMNLPKLSFISIISFSTSAFGPRSHHAVMWARFSFPRANSQQTVSGMKIININKQVGNPVPIMAHQYQLRAWPVMKENKIPDTIPIWLNVPSVPLRRGGAVSEM